MGDRKVKQLCKMRNTTPPTKRSVFLDLKPKGLEFIPHKYIIPIKKVPVPNDYTQLNHRSLFYFKKCLNSDQATRYERHVS